MRCLFVSRIGRRLCSSVVGVVALLAWSGAGRAQTLTPTETYLQGVDTPINYGTVIANYAIEGVCTVVDGVCDGISGGEIDFYVDGVDVCQMTAGEGGTCPYPTGLEPDGSSYPVGTHIIYSAYLGDSTYAASSSPPQAVVMLPVIAGPTASVYGDAVTFTGTVGDAAYNVAGTVSFMEGSTVLGSQAVQSDGTASFTTSSLAVGTHNITACLLDSADGKTYCSTPLTIVVTAPTPPPPPPPPPGPVTYTLTVNPTAISVGVGNSVAVQVVVTALNGYSQPVQLGCSGLPFETTCTFAQSLIPAGGGSTTLLVSPAAPHSCGVSTPDFVAPNLKVGMAGLLLSVLAMFGMWRRRRLVKGLVLLMVLSALSGLSGCGTKCKDFGTEPTNYTFTVTGTSMGSPVTSETVTMKMNVHL